MKNLIITGHWMIWFYIIVLLPFQVYDFYKKENRKAKDYAYIAFVLIFALIYILSSVFSSQINNVILQPYSILFWTFIIIIYLQSLYELANERSKRNYLFCTIFTIGILMHFLSLILL